MKADEREMMRPGGVRFVTAAKMDESCEKIIIGIIFPSISVASIKVKVCQRDPSTGVEARMHNGSYIFIFIVFISLLIFVVGMYDHTMGFCYEENDERHCVFCL